MSPRPRWWVAGTIAALSAIVGTVTVWQSRQRQRLASVSSLPYAPSSPHRSARTVRVAISPFISYAPLLIAQAEGFFADEGVQVEFVSAMRSEESLVALITGDIDVRPGPLHAGFFSAVAQGAPIRMVAAMGYLASNGCTYFGIAVRRDMDSTALPNIRRMRASQDGATRFIVQRMLAQRGVQISSLETVRLPDPVLANALTTGSIDAVATSEPLLTRVTDLGRLWLSGQDAAPDFQWGVLAFGDRLLHRDRETGIRFLRAYRRGIAQYNTGKTERNVQVIADGTAETADATRRACWLSFDEGSRVHGASIDAFQSWARDAGFLQRLVPLSGTIDSTLVAASDRPVTY